MSLTVKKLPAMRVVGLSMLAIPGKSDFAGLWKNQLFPRMNEIQFAPNGTSLGICRCAPAGSPQGTFEYIAAFMTTPDAPVPAGMIEVNIPACDYAAFGVNDFSEFGPVWHKTRTAIDAQTEWLPYCGKQGCECATHPAFELYDPKVMGKADVCIPVKRS
jgi:predicted transcriptional regulator YdeE